jgi:hypothetical protein
LIPGKGKRFFSFLKKCCTGSGAYPAFFSVGNGVLFLSIEWLEHEVDHSPPYVYRVKNKWNYISAPQFALVVWAGTTLPSPSSIGGIVMEAELSQND